jgi:micrococcal nuclease
VTGSRRLRHLIPGAFAAVGLALSVLVPASAGLGLSRARVTSITDGDTIRARLSANGREERIRLIGIDTPERGDRCFTEASAFTERKAPAGTRIWLEFDQERRDRYDRLLAYVWLTEPRDRTGRSLRDSLLNAKIVNKGWAEAYPYAPNTKYSGPFSNMERAARQADRGQWGANCRRVGGGTGGGGSGSCDPAYPDFCISSPPPDLDCSDIGRRNFTVRSPDPHRFDGDFDGRGCES